jgi:hypothetical protein
MVGFSLYCPKKGCAQTMAMKVGWSPLPDERFGFGGGSANSPLEVEGFWIGVDFMLKIFFCVFKIIMRMN